MNILIKSARVVDPNSPHHNKTVNILIENGTIVHVTNQKLRVPGSFTIIEEDNLYVSPGFFDLQVNFRDPGYEYKEDLLSGCAAAAAGGFTGVAVMPSTCPPIDNKVQVEYLRKKTAGNLVDVFPIGCITRGMNGKELAEMYDMYTAGAIAFSDDKKPISDSGLMLRALLYAKDFDALIMTNCDDKTISMNGQMHEGKISTTLGLKGIPALAEKIMVARNLYLCEYTKGRMHFSSISTADSVALIRKAKRKGLPITASVNAYNLALDDSALNDFDTNCKVNPPLRTKTDIDALKNGLADGTLDAIASDHSPEDIENKNIEFDCAAFGMAGIETAFALANSNISIPNIRNQKGEIARLSLLVKLLAINPRKILKLPVPKIKTGEKANLTLFLPKKQFIFEEKNIRSKSKNTPFIGKKLTGKIVAVVNNNMTEIF